MSYDPALGDAWRGTARNVEECLFNIRRHQMRLSRRDSSPHDRNLSERRLPFWLDRYLTNIRAVSLYEIEMDDIGMEYARSSHDWREANG